MDELKYHRVTLEPETSADDFLVFRQGSGPTVEIYDIQVGNERRRQGRGQKLIDMLLAHRLPKGTKTLWAITRIENIPAHRFYEKCGFRVIGVLHNFYRDTGFKNVADAVMFGRDV